MENLTKKILISSLSLYNYIDKCFESESYPENISIITIDDKLLIPSMDKEQKGIYYYQRAGLARNYDCLISVSQLHKLRKFLDLIGEQPIVLILDESNNCIHISEALI
jgi:hypothetical protein